MGLSQCLLNHKTKTTSNGRLPGGTWNGRWTLDFNSETSKQPLVGLSSNVKLLSPFFLNLSNSFLSYTFLESQNYIKVLNVYIHLLL
jgi:hypothetical protein